MRLVSWNIRQRAIWDQWQKWHGLVPRPDLRRTAVRHGLFQRCPNLKGFGREELRDARSPPSRTSVFVTCRGSQRILLEPDVGCSAAYRHRAFGWQQSLPVRTGYEDLGFAYDADSDETVG